MNKLPGTSADILAENIAKIKQLFPEVFTEDKIDFERLQEVLGEYVNDKEEKYRFEWNGKSKALRLSQTPSTGTLRPCKEESKNWDTTENLYIEGDNLEVLKLLQKTYHNRIKLIYIDPPYNTGGDFVYKDDFKDNLKNYLEITGQTDGEGKKLSTNSETSGRYHTDWLNMMYPRLRLARNLLTDEGVIFISIDDNEVDNLKKACNELFGEENFICSLIWKSRQNKDNRNLTGVSSDHEYIVVYSKSPNIRVLKGSERNTAAYSNPDNDPRGDWTSANMVGLLPADQRPNCHYDLINPKTKINYGKPKMGWRYDMNTMNKLINEERILWPEKSTGRPRRKVFITEISDTPPGFSSIVGTDIYTRNGTIEIDELFKHKYFDFPKPSTLVKDLIDQSTKDDNIVLDFFSGSATTAHATMQLNAEDGSNRKFIMVQLPEPTDKNSEAYKGGYKNICEIGKERIRRAGEKIKEEMQGQQQLKLGEEPKEVPDIGFKVFKLDSSNLKKWNPDYENLENSLMDMVSNYVDGRTEEDVLYEIMLKYGIDLTYPIETEVVEGKQIFNIGYGSLFVCLADGIDMSIAKRITQKRDELMPDDEDHKEQRNSVRVVFKDNGFKDDSTKTNVEMELERCGFEEVVSV